MSNACRRGWLVDREAVRHIQHLTRPHWLRENLMGDELSHRRLALARHGGKSAPPVRTPRQSGVATELSANYGKEGDAAPSSF